MSTPGFAANSSLYTSGQVYRGLIGAARSQHNIIAALAGPGGGITGQECIANCMEVCTESNTPLQTCRMNCQRACTGGGTGPVSGTGSGGSCFKDTTAGAACCTALTAACFLACATGTAGFGAAVCAIGCGAAYGGCIDCEVWPCNKL